jgi:hypothetical protein
MTERHLFDVAVAIGDPARRRAYLEDACRDDPALRERVEQLLQSHSALLGPAARSFLAGPVVRRAERSIRPPPPTANPLRTAPVPELPVDGSGIVAATFPARASGTTPPRRRGWKEVMAVVMALFAVIATVVLLLSLLH